MNTHDDLLNYNEDMCFLPQDDIEDVCLQRNDDTCRDGLCLGQHKTEAG